MFFAAILTSTALLAGRPTTVPPGPRAGAPACAVAMADALYDPASRDATYSSDTARCTR